VTGRSVAAWRARGVARARKPRRAPRARRCGLGARLHAARRVAARRAARARGRTQTRSRERPFCDGGRLRTVAVFLHAHPLSPAAADARPARSAPRAGTDPKPRPSAFVPGAALLPPGAHGPPPRDHT
jgi:hypothetical protein